MPNMGVNRKLFENARQHVRLKFGSGALDRKTIAGEGAGAQKQSKLRFHLSNEKQGNNAKMAKRTPAAATRPEGDSSRPPISLSFHTHHPRTLVSAAQMVSKGSTEGERWGAASSGTAVANLRCSLHSRGADEGCRPFWARL